MASPAPALPPLTFPIITSQLAIATHLYAHVLAPRILTNAHIAAIRINAHSTNDPESSNTATAITNITSAAIAAETQTLIRQAKAYGEYERNLTPEQRVERGIIEDYIALEWCASEGMSLAGFGVCILNWIFMERLRIEGEWLQREVLEDAWRAYGEVDLEVRMRMVALKEDDDEAMGDYMDGDFN